MSITLTSDPIVTEQTVSDLLKLTGDEARLHINSVSARFLEYTGRLRITNGAVTEWQCGRGLNYFWLHATPITSITSIATYSSGDLSETIASGDYSYNATTGKIVLHGTIAPYSDGEQNIKAVYAAGWAAALIPGDLVQSALAMIRFDKARLDGRIGTSSESREGFSTSYETGDLPKSVQQVWDRYRYRA